MQELYFNSKMICSVTEKQYEQFKLLCPYWGLSLIEGANVILGALSTFMMGVHGLSPKKFKQLSQLLAHTGLSLSSNRDATGLQHLSINVDPLHHMPVSLRTDARDTFYLNPLQPDSSMSVQKSVHKHITLKPKKGNLHITFSAEHEENMCEYLAYIIIQTYLRSEFTSLANISGNDFSTLNHKVLHVINPLFSSIQTRNTQVPHVDVDPLISKSNKQTKTALIYDDSDHWQAAESAGSSAIHAREMKSTTTRVHPFNPFRQRNEVRSVISPFQADSPQKNRETIRPFQLNQHTPSAASEYSNHTFLTYKKGRGKDE